MPPPIHLLTLRNCGQEPITLFLEPWAYEFPIAPGSEIELRADDHDPALIVDWQPGMVKVWPNRMVALLQDGKDLTADLLIPFPGMLESVRWWLRGIDAVGDHLRKRGELPIRDSDGLMVRTEHGFVLFHLDEKERLLRVTAPLAWRVSAERLAEMNAQLPVLGFRFLGENVAFVTHVQVDPDGLISADAVERSLDYVKATVARFL
jgi:hypothetical protein